jgi:hypothetical protein
MKTTIDTIEQAAKLIGKRPASITCPGGLVPMTLLRVTSCGIHRDRQPWIGFDHHQNDDLREVVAPAAVLFLPVTIEIATEETPCPDKTTTT